MSGKYSFGSHPGSDPYTTFWDINLTNIPCSTGMQYATETSQIMQVFLFENFEW